MRKIRWLLLLFGTFLSCQGNETPLEPTELQITETIDGLLQILIVSPASPRTGDTLEISSSVVNMGPVERTLILRTCGLDLQTDLVLQDDVPRCGGETVQATVLPQDTLSLEGTPAGGIIQSPPGEYVIRVRHLRVPDHWVVFALGIRGQ